MKLKINYKKSIWLMLSLVFVLADQWSKIYVKTNFELLKSKEVIEGFFYITHHKNTGAAWGIFQNGTIVLAIISGMVTLVLIFFLLKLEHKFAGLSLSLTIAGAVGNLIDRIAFMEVTDFLDFYIFGYDFPIFNIADMCIVVGTIFLSIYILFIYKEEKVLNEQ